MAHKCRIEFLAFGADISTIRVFEIRRTEFPLIKHIIGLKTILFVEPTSLAFFTSENGKRLKILSTN